MTDKEIIENLRILMDAQRVIIQDQSNLLKEFKSYISVLSRAPLLADRTREISSNE